MKQQRPQFEDGDVVMICHHLFEDAREGKDISWAKVRWHGKHIPPKRFIRVDGTGGTYHYAVYCAACAKSPEVDYIEEVWRNGQLHVADFMAERHRVQTS